MIKIECSNNYGGAIIRTILSIILLKPLIFDLISIRKSRPKPGLHDQAVQVLEQLTLAGEIDCIPEPTIGLENLTIKGLGKQGRIDLQIHSRGSIWLILQSFYIPILMRGGSIQVTGRNFGIGSPPCLEYISKILTLCNLEKYLDLQINRPNDIFATVILSRNDTAFDCQTYGGVKIVHSWSPFKNPLPKKTFIVDKSNRLALAIGKNQKASMELFKWMMGVLETTGYCPYAYDQLLMFAMVLGGTIACHELLNATDLNGDRYDFHVQALLELNDQIAKQCDLFSSVEIDRTIDKPYIILKSILQSNN